MQFSCLYSSRSCLCEFGEVYPKYIFASYYNIPIYCKINKIPKVITYIEKILPGAVYTV